MNLTTGIISQCAGAFNVHNFVKYTSVKQRENPAEAEEHYTAVTITHKPQANAPGYRGHCTTAPSGGTRVAAQRRWRSSLKTEVTPWTEAAPHYLPTPPSSQAWPDARSVDTQGAR